MSESLVSVILPTHNRAGTLRRAVDSVLAQTYTNLELIVVDDGSTDDTQALLAECRDPRLKVLAPGRLGSAARARNHGLNAAQGEFVAFQDSDDAWLIEKLERQIAYADAHLSAAVIACGYLVVMTDGVRAEYRGASLMERRTDFVSLIRYGHQISTPAWLVRREVLQHVGDFDEQLDCWEDWELSMRLDAAGGFVMLDEPLLVTFETEGSVKYNFDAYARTLDAVMVKHPSWVTNTRRIRARHEWLQATWELRMNRPDSARRYLRAAFETDASYWRLWAGALKHGRRFLAAPVSRMSGA